MYIKKKEKVNGVEKRIYATSNISKKLANKFVGRMINLNDNILFHTVNDGYFSFKIIISFSTL